MSNSTKADWQLTTATVYSADWVPRTRNDFCHFNVVYSYRVGNEYYEGAFDDYGSENESYLKRDDAIQIRYNPVNPKQSFYPQRRSALKRRLFWVGLPIGFAALVLLILYLSGSFK